MGEILSNITELLIAGDIAKVGDLCKQALEQGSGAAEIMEEALFPGMDVVGQRMKSGEMFIPEVLRSAKAMQAGMEALKDELVGKSKNLRGTVVIGTVQGDLHDIGKNLVNMLLEGAGFKVVDLGVDIKPQQFIEAAKEHDASIVAMSALLTTTMPKMAETIEAITEAGLREQVKIMVGGAPVTQSFADEIGGDAYASDAAGAADKAKELVGC